MWERGVIYLQGSCRPGNSGNHEGGRPIANFWAVHTVWRVAEERKEHWWAFFAFLMALK